MPPDLRTANCAMNVESGTNDLIDRGPTHIGTLDCETAESTYLSLERILGLPRRHLDEFFQKTDVDLLCSRTIDGDPGRSLLKELRREIPSACDYQRTCWFHLTRILPGTTFDEGILPLPQCCERVWEMLYLIADRRVPRAVWDAFKTNMDGSHHAWLYNMKMEGAIHWGPFGMLVRDHAFIAEIIGQPRLPPRSGNR
jgi:hypothetical protein